MREWTGKQIGSYVSFVKLDWNLGYFNIYELSAITENLFPSWFYSNTWCNWGKCLKLRVQVFKTWILLFTFFRIKHLSRHITVVPSILLVWNDLMLTANYVDQHCAAQPERSCTASVLRMECLRNALLLYAYTCSA